MNTTNRNYESLYIVDPALTDDQVDSIIEKYSKVIVDQGAQVHAAGRWDKRRLAYDVSGHREGIYILMYFAGEPAATNELDRVFRIADDVFRHIIVRVEPERIDTSLIKQRQPSAEAPEEAPVGKEPTEEPPGEMPEAAAAEEPAEPAEQAEAEVETKAETELSAEDIAAEAPAAEEEPPAAEEQPPAEQKAEEIPADEQNIEPKKEGE